MSREESWTGDFDELVTAIAGTPVMTADQGRRIWRHFLQYRPERVLDVGTCYGTSAAYMAGALRHLGRGEVVTVDSSQFDDESPAKDIVVDLLRRCDLAEWVQLVRMPHSSYAWWLLEEAQRHRSHYDFIYLDGAKHFEIDTTAVVLAEQLLRPGGWLLLDDLPWCYADRPEYEPTTVLGNGVRYRFSPAQRTTPHVSQVFEHVVRPHPGFGEYRLDADGQWAWARKTSQPVRRPRVTVTVDEDVPLRTLARAAARRAVRKR